MTEMIPFDINQDSASQLPAHLQGANLSVNKALLATAGISGNRIGLKGSRFRLVVGGKEERVFDENYLDVIVVGVVPAISRMYYEGEYDANVKAPPTCYSADGIAPPLDLETRQSDKCETCQWNVKGSKVVGNVKMKACAYFQRLVVMLPGDDSGNLYKLDVKAQGLFGESYANVNRFNIRDYAKFIANRGVDVSALITRLSFDTEQSVPKLLFSPVGYINAADYERVKDTVGSSEVEQLLKISMATVDLSHEVSEDEQGSDEPVTPASEQTAAPTPAKENKPAAAPPPPKAAEEPAKKHYKKTAKAGDFDIHKDFLDAGWTVEQLLTEGYLIEVEPPAPPKPAAPPAPPKPAAPPTPPKPAAPPTPPKPSAPAAAGVENVPMPGAKPTPPAGPPKPPTQAAAAAAAAAAAPTQATTVQETSTDEELQAIIGELM